MLVENKWRNTQHINESILTLNLSPENNIWTISRTLRPLADNKHLEVSQGKPPTVCFYHVCMNSHTPAALTCKMHGCPWAVVQGRTEHSGGVSRKTNLSLHPAKTTTTNWNHWKTKGTGVTDEEKNQRLNRKLGAKNKKRERRNAESLLFGASPEGLTTTASLSHLFSRCVWPRTLLGCCQGGAPPLPISTVRWLVDAAQHCIAGEGWPPPPLHLTKITLLHVLPCISNTSTIVGVHFHLGHATRFSSFCISRAVLHTHYRCPSRVCCQLDWLGDVYLHSSVRENVDHK